METIGILNLITHTLFFSIGCFAVSQLLPPTDSFGISRILNVLTPSLSGEWWFVSCYFQLYLLMPLLNAAISKMDKKAYSISLVLLLVITSVMPCIGIWKSAQWTTGNDTLWFITLYLISAYIKKFNISFKSSKSLIVYIIAGAGMVLSRLVIGTVTSTVFGSVKAENIMYTYNSVLTVIASIALFMFMKDITLKGKTTIKIVAFLSKYSFGVYLWHANPNISKYLFGFINSARFAHRLGAMIGYMIIMVVVCYLIGVVCDYIFIVFEKLLRLRKLTSWIDMKVNKLLKVK